MTAEDMAAENEEFARIEREQQMKSQATRTMAREPQPLGPGWHALARWVIYAALFGVLMFFLATFVGGLFLWSLLI